MRYQVMKQYGRGVESFCDKFEDLSSAEDYIKKNITAEAQMNVSVIYRIVELGDVISEFDSTKINLSTTTQQESGSKGMGSGPSPFSTAPRPAGIPQSRSGNQDNDKEKK